MEKDNEPRSRLDQGLKLNAEPKPKVLIRLRTNPSSSNLRDPETLYSSGFARAGPKQTVPSSTNLRDPETLRSFTAESALSLDCTADAIRLLRLHTEAADNGFRRQLVEAIEQDPKVLDDHSACHELFELLLQHRNLRLTLRFCACALKEYPYDIRLLTDGMFLCTKLSNFQDGGQLLTHILNQSQEALTPELLAGCIDFLAVYAQSVPQQKDPLWDRAQQLASLMEETLWPKNELGYLKHAELLLRRQKSEEAIFFLRRCILEPKTPPEGEPFFLHSPQCCLLLLQLLNTSDDYELRARVASKGFQYANADGDPELIDHFQEQLQRAFDARRAQERDQWLSGASPADFRKIIETEYLPTISNASPE